MIDPHRIVGQWDSSVCVSVLSVIRQALDHLRSVRAGSPVQTKNGLVTNEQLLYLYSNYKFCPTGHFFVIMRNWKRKKRLNLHLCLYASCFNYIVVTDR